MSALQTKLHEAGVLPPQKAGPAAPGANLGGKLPFVATQDVKAGQVGGLDDTPSV